MKDLIITILILLLVITLFVGITALTESATCYSQTRDIGFAHRWGLMSGCMIEVNPGQWIPLDNYYFKQQ